MPKNILITSTSSGIGAPAARELTGLRLVPHDPREAAAAQAPALDDADPVAHLASAIAALLLEAIAGGEPSDPAATAALLGAVAELPGKESRPSLPPGGPAWSAEPLTQSETRVLQFLPTYMSAPEIAAELCVSANTVRTHVRHVYRKLGARSRHEAVQRACATGLLPASSCSHRHRSETQLWHCRLTIARTDSPDPDDRPGTDTPGTKESPVSLEPARYRLSLS
jgi:DNA-binding CsgD family transcriptional regulator